MDPDSTPRGSSLCHGYSWYPMSGFSTPEKHQKISCFRKFVAGNNSDPYALKSLGLEGNLHPSPIFIDVGANLGLVSISLAKQWPFARILALEPAPATFRYLLWNLKENQVTSQAQHEWALVTLVVVEKLWVWKHAHVRAMLGGHCGFSRDLCPGRKQTCFCKKRVILVLHPQFGLKSLIFVA